MILPYSDGSRNWRQHKQVIRKRLKGIRIRNWFVYSFAGLFLCLAFLSFPTDPTIFFPQDRTAKFPFQVLRISKDATVAIAQGVVFLSGKDSISANNLLTVDVLLVVNRTAWGGDPSNVNVALPGAFPDPIITTALGIPGWVGMHLTKQGNKWVGTGKVRYNQGGSLPIIIEIDKVEYPAPERIEMGSEDTRIAARTNSLLVSLTWAILLFAVLELREKNPRRENKNAD